ncbi:MULTISPECIES: hypothetical protein [Variovorax]|jgi:hypothetical protein|uniref:hypothetical protein n=1 Tax=Variovorax TaxID=34072 RepID=UPI00086960ED|nr:MULTISPECIES: hypothetical protein [Variovorax]MBN8758524.1 hypothetical protein [Variovorax sp.]ODU18799.1 MAG: hypothetical protein ABS94_02815 [Variovorax sp. SCN 67-85]ODV17974.1 MAG: hypothetical protein ABT25_28675 [Variovorax sp. SCN 67-20]OJZ05683.1 MAG: hypothetical protein BGP22_22050 [Variovorax sp. 67-131]UKI07598.1 hypothetical protein L3V85_33180 [Variovorax paradoxus]
MPKKQDPKSTAHPLRGEFWLLIAVFTCIATLALLQMAVERERSLIKGGGKADAVLLSSSPGFYAR